jgi:capsular exopolysaccharide synthesis family protein
MSHLHNLFHNSSSQGNGSNPSPTLASIATVVEKADGSTVSAVVTPLPDFPIEQAHISAVSRLVVYSDPRSPAADRFRYLRMRLREHWIAGKLKKLLVTSPLAHDGKSMMVINLATALAERGKRSVLVVEADLHHASLADSLKVNHWIGLTECLQDTHTQPLSAIRRIEPLGWYLLPAGEPRRNPTELLQTPTFGNIVTQLAGLFDWVVIDSPPVVPLTDAIALQQHADASLLVVRAGQTPEEAISQTIELLGKKKIAGIVLNGIERRDQPYYQQRYYEGVPGKSEH